MRAGGPKASSSRLEPGEPPAAGSRAYHVSVRIFSVIALALGAVLIVSTLVRGGGPLSVGVLMGLAFLGVGAARLWLSLRTSG